MNKNKIFYKYNKALNRSVKGSVNNPGGKTHTACFQVFSMQ